MNSLVLGLRSVARDQLVVRCQVPGLSARGGTGLRGNSSRDWLTADERSKEAGTIRPAGPLVVLPNRFRNRGGGVAGDLGEVVEEEFCQVLQRDAVVAAHGLVEAVGEGEEGFEGGQASR